MGSVSITLSPGFLLELKDSEFSYDIPGSMSLNDLILGWCAKNAPELPERLFDKNTGGIAGNAMILLNGNSVKSEDPKKLLISPGDKISMHPILIGG